MLVSSLVSSCCCHMPHTLTQTHNMRQAKSQAAAQPLSWPTFKAQHAKPQAAKTTYSRIVSIMSAKDLLSQPVATALIRAVSGRRSIACFIPGILSLLPHAAHIDTNTQHASTKSQAAAQPLSWQTFNAQTACQTASSKKQHTAALSASCLQRTSSASPSQLLSSGQSVEGEVLLVSSLVSSCCCHMPHTLTQTHNMRQAKSQAAAQPLSWPTFKAQHAKPQAAKNNIQPH